MTGRAKTAYAIRERDNGIPCSVLRFKNREGRDEYVRHYPAIAVSGSDPRVRSATRAESSAAAVVAPGDWYDEIIPVAKLVEGLDVLSEALEWANKLRGFVPGLTYRIGEALAEVAAAADRNR